MTASKQLKNGDTLSSAPPRPADETPSLSPAAQRALAEARARRDAEQVAAAAREIDGRGGLEPVRYGDWEVKGLASDF